MTDLLNPLEHKLISRLVQSPGFCWAVPGSRLEGTIFPEVLEHFGRRSGDPKHEIRDVILRLVERNLISAVWDRPRREDRLGRHRESPAISSRDKPNPEEWDLRSLALLGSGRRIYEAYTHTRTTAVLPPVPAKPAKAPAVRPRVPATTPKPRPSTAATNKSRRRGPLDTSPPPPRGQAAVAEQLALHLVQRERSPSATKPTFRPVEHLSPDAPIELVILEILERVPNLALPGHDAVAPLLVQLDLHGRRGDLPPKEQIQELHKQLRRMNIEGHVRLSFTPKGAVSRLTITSAGRSHLNSSLEQRSSA